MRRLISNIISVCVTFIRFCVIKLFHFKSFSFGNLDRFSPNVIVEIEHGSNLKIGKRVRAHSRCIFKSRKGGSLIIHNNVSFNYGCMAFAKCKIEIGEGTEFGPDVKIYDHDHDFRCLGGIKANKYLLSPVMIGKNVWIGANTIILRGTTIGDNCVVGAGCVLKGNYPADSVIVQKRITELKN